MNKLVFPKDVHDALEAIGEWVIDGKGTSIFGVLHHEPTKLANLKILGMDKVDAPKTIIGKREGGLYITVFDAVGSRFHGNMLDPETCITEYGFSSFWEGPQCFAKKSDVKFRQATFGINGLEGWYSPPAFKYRNMWKGCDKIEIKYQRPKTIQLFSDDNVTIKIGYSVQTSGVSVAQNHIEVAHVPRVIIRVKKGKLPFYEGDKSLETYIRFAHNFLALLIGKDALTYDLSCTSEYLLVRKAEKRKAGLKIIRNEQIFKYYWSRTLPSEIKSDPLSVLIPLTNHSRIVRAAQRFATAFFTNEDLFESIVAYTYSWKSFTENTLPEQVFLFEGLCKILFIKNCRAEKLRRVKSSGDWDMIEQIKSLPTINGNKKLSVIASRLFTPDPSLNDMLTVAFSRTSAIFGFLHDKQISKTIKAYLGKRRNGTAHSGNQGRISVEKEVWCSRFLQMESLALILLYCGFSKTIVKKYFDRPFTGYSYLLKTLPQMNGKANTP